MGDIFIGGTCEYPYTRYKDPALLSKRLNDRLKSEDPTDKWREVKNWPQGAIDEWSDDNGIKAAIAHREQLIIGHRAIRKELDRFQPDAVLIFNQEHFENFKEDILPAFCLYCADTHRVEPNHMLARGPLGESEWDEGPEVVWNIPGNKSVARYVANKLMDAGFDVATAYKGLHLERLAHTFTGVINYLNWDRTGWNFPTVPIHLNCDGEKDVPLEMRSGDAYAPKDLLPARPFRIFDLGRSLAEIILESPYRIAILGGAAWSHGGHCEKNGFLFPDLEADVVMYEALENRDFDTWRNKPIQTLVDDGQEELLTWYPTVGALSVIEPPKRYTQFVGAHLFNSNKVFAAYAN